MKNQIATLILAMLGAGSLTSCVELDSDRYFEDRTTLERVFNNKVQSQEWLAYAYSFLLGPNRDAGSKTQDFFTTFDDCLYFGDRDPKYDPGRNTRETYNAFRMGEYDENWNNNAWDACWKGINQASIFIDNIDGNKDMTEKERIDYKGQARFVRAYFYWLLLRKYGPVPIAPEHGVDYTKPYEDLYQARNTYEEVADYIGKEMVQAAKEIQYTKRDAENIGRPTKGACLATRALAYIYAASPLANGQLKNGNYHNPAKVSDAIAKEFVNQDGTHLLSLDYDESKWARAAAACRDVMDLGVYQLYHYHFVSNASAGSPVTIVPPDDHNFAEKTWPEGWKDIDPQKSYAYLFNGQVSAVENPELIFTRGSNIADNDGMDAMVLHEMPVSASGWNTHGLTQKMVDAYYMKDGTDVPGKDSEMNGGDGSQRVKGWTQNDTDYPPLAKGVSLQYANREPRFYASVAYSGSIWERLGDTQNRDQWMKTPVFYYRGGGDGYTNSVSHLRTGIGIKKWYNPKDYIADRNNAYATLGLRDRVEPAIRYADILLMYAEALNELDGKYEVPSWDGSRTYSISRDINEIKKGIQPIRIRAGLPDYSSSVYGNKNNLRVAIKRERMIELMGEGKRYYDLRRWMDAPVEESEPIYGLNVFMTESRRDDFMKIVPTSELQSTFTKKMYFWPVTFYELKRNLKLVQAPGWKSYD